MLKGGVVYNAGDGVFACLICMGPLCVPAVSLPCGHSFCEGCIKDVVGENRMQGRMNICPYIACGAKFQSISAFLRPNQLLGMLLPQQTYILPGSGVQSVDMRELMIEAKDFSVTPAHLAAARERLLYLQENYNTAVRAYEAQQRADLCNRLTLYEQQDVSAVLGVIDASMVERGKEVFRGLPDKVYKAVILDRSWLAHAGNPAALSAIRQLPLFGIVARESVLVIPATASQIETAIKLMRDMHYQYKHVLLQESRQDDRSTTKKPKASDVSIVLYYLIGALNTRLFDEPNKHNKVTTVRTVAGKCSVTTEKLMKLLSRFAPRLTLFTSSVYPGSDIWGGPYLASVSATVQVASAPASGTSKRRITEEECDEEEDPTLTQQTRLITVINNRLAGKKRSF